MSGVSLIDLQIEYARRRESYVKNAARHLEKIKEVCRRFDPGCSLIVFGSFARGTLRVDSDVDVLVITEIARRADRRAELRAAIAREIGLVTPFEIHIATPEEYEKWYKRFIDACIEV